MCGLVGLIDLAGRLEASQRRRLVAAMGEHVAHRGPDGAGLLDLEGIGATYGHRRLRVIDLSSAGEQPMRSACGRYVLCYNGEVYNTRELRDRLGHEVRWRGHCDTEVVLEYLSKFGIDALGDLNGMFAIAIHDLKTQTITLARDRFGQKPIYYALGADWFAFASELRPLGMVPWIDTSVNRDAMAQYLLLQYVPAPRSMYAGVSKLEPGTLMQVHLDAAGSRVHADAPTRYFQWKPTELDRANFECNPPDSFEEAMDEFEQLLDASVRRRLVSDVPLGVFLSGGIDSALVAESMVRQSGSVRVQSFSIGFEGSAESEHREAREAAGVIGTHHQDEIVRPDVITLMPEIAAYLDEPLGDSGALPMWCLSKMTRQCVTVALSGDGGDELFGGYQRYLETLREARWPWRRWRHARRSDHPYEAGRAYCSERFWMFMPDVISRLMGSISSSTMGVMSTMRERINQNDAPLIHRMRHLDVDSYLPGAVLTKVDRMTMAFGLEARSPFLDPSIAAFAAQLPAHWCATSGELKRLLRGVARRRFPRSWAQRPKRGFGLPSAAWNRPDLLGMCEDLLCSSDSLVAAHMDSDAIRWWVNRQKQEHAFSVFQVWTMLILELWLRHNSQSEDGRFENLEHVPQIHTVSAGALRGAAR